MCIENLPLQNNIIVMKKFSRLVVLSIGLTGMLLQSGCYGSFKLVGKVYEWNGSIEDKFVRSIVFWALCIIPVYPVAAFVDAVIFNLIEFWSGSNPVSMKEGQYEQQIVHYRNRTYLLEATKNRFSVTELKSGNRGKTVQLVYTPQNYTWNLEQDNKLIAVSSFEKGKYGELSLRVFSKDGNSKLLPHPQNISWTAFSESELTETAMRVRP